VEIGDGEAEAGRRLETARRGVHSDRGRSEGIVGRENQGSPVLAIVIRCVWRSGEDVVPFKDV